MLERDAFARCESDGLLALAMARQAFWFNATAEDVANLTGVDEQSWVAELFQRKESGDLKNHVWFASEKFRECAAREGLELTLREQERTTTCYARVDIVFLLAAAREKGGSQATAIAAVKAGFAGTDPKNFPDGLPAQLAQLAPLVFQSADGAQDRELGRQAFASCTFPRDWNGWRKAHAAEARLPAAPVPAKKAAAAPRTSGALAKRLARCAAGMSWHAEALHELGEPVDGDVFVVNHYLRVGCGLVGADEVRREWAAQRDALQTALRAELKRGKPEAAMKKVFQEINANLDACEAEEDESFELVRAAEASNRDACQLDYAVE
jgi:hypothetical protein